MSYFWLFPSDERQLYCFSFQPQENAKNMEEQSSLGAKVIIKATFALIAILVWNGFILISNGPAALASLFFTNRW